MLLRNLSFVMIRYVVPALYSIKDRYVGKVPCRSEQASFPKLFGSNEATDKDKGVANHSQCAWLCPQPVRQTARDTKWGVQGMAD